MMSGDPQQQVECLLPPGDAFDKHSDVVTSNPISLPNREEWRKYLSSLVAVGSARQVSRTSTEDQIEDHIESLVKTPIIGKLSKLNFLVEQLTMEQVTSQLQNLKVGSASGLQEENVASGQSPQPDDWTEGSQESCKRRLKHHLRNQAVSNVLNKTFPANYYYDCICVVDFEATCDGTPRRKFLNKESSEPITGEEEESRTPSPKPIQEIIEFPAFLVDVKKQKIVATFHHFVKPSLSPSLSSFCTQLTGITQDVVEAASSFVEVLDAFEDWLYRQLKRNGFESFTFATDGPWDFSHFFAATCRVNKILYPPYAKRWINIKKIFSTHYKIPQASLTVMLRHLGMEFEGKPHSGFDDTKNIARILIRMLLDGANPVINERISWHAIKRIRWSGIQAGVVMVPYGKKFDGLDLSDSDDDDISDDPASNEEKTVDKIYDDSK